MAEPLKVGGFFLVYPPKLLPVFYVFSFIIFYDSFSWFILSFGTDTNHVFSSL
jgi:hypothetical protein